MSADFFTTENIVFALRVLTILMLIASAILVVKTIRLSRETRALLRKLAERENK